MTDKGGEEDRNQNMRTVQPMLGANCLSESSEELAEYSRAENSMARLPLM